MVIYRNVNERNARAIIGVGLIEIDKGMLAPVANHETKSHEKQRNQDDTEGGPRVQFEQIVYRVVCAQLPECCLHGDGGSSLAEEVTRQIEPDEEVEFADIMEEVKNVVALVPESG